MMSQRNKTTSCHDDSNNRSTSNYNMKRTIIVFTIPYNIQCSIVLRALQIRHIDYVEINISTSSSSLYSGGNYETFMNEYYTLMNFSYSVPKICIYYHRSNNSNNNSDNDNIAINEDINNFFTIDDDDSNNRNNNIIHIISGVDDILQEIRRIDFSSNYNVIPFDKYTNNCHDDENGNDIDYDDYVEYNSIMNLNENSEEYTNNNHSENNNNSIRQKRNNKRFLILDCWLMLYYTKTKSLSSLTFNEEKKKVKEAAKNEERNEGIKENGIKEGVVKEKEEIIIANLIEFDHDQDVVQKEVKDDDKVRDEEEVRYDENVGEDDNYSKDEEVYIDVDMKDYSNNETILNTMMLKSISDIMIPLNDINENDNENDCIKISYNILMEQLLKHLPSLEEDNDYTFVGGSCYYKNVFNGYDLEQCLVHHVLPMNIIDILFFHKNLSISSSYQKLIYKEKMNTIGKYLLKYNIIYFINKSHNINKTSYIGDKNIYLRLQCHNESNVLNSYYNKDHMINAIKYKPSAIICPIQFIRYIHEQLLYPIQYDCMMNNNDLSSNNDNLLIDYKNCKKHPLYIQLEYVMCQFHIMKLNHLNRIEMITFILNLYHIIISYTFIKFGCIPCTEMDRLHFFQNIYIRMNHSKLFNISDWIDGIIRCNKFTLNNPLCEYLLNLHDNRILFDPRIHFAIQIDIGVSNTIPFNQYQSNIFNLQLKMVSCTFFEETNHFSILHHENNCSNSNDNNNDRKMKTIIQLNYMIGKIYRNDFIHHYNTNSNNSNNNDSNSQKQSEQKKKLMKDDHHILLLSLKEYMPKPIQRKVDNILQQNDKDEIDIQYTIGHWNRYATNYSMYKPYTILNEMFCVIYNIHKNKESRYQLASTKNTRNEKQRIDTLRQLNINLKNDKILTTYDDHTEFCDSITKSLQDELVMPIVMLSFIDTNRQLIYSQQWSLDIPMVSTNASTLDQEKQKHQKEQSSSSSSSLNEYYIKRDVSICGHTIMIQRNDNGYDYDDILIIDDTSLDDRFASSPYVQANQIRFYAGVAISVPNINKIRNDDDNPLLFNVGTLCVQDIIPRTLSNHNKRILKQYVKQIQIELIRRALEIKTQEQPKQQEKEDAKYQSINTKVK